MRTETKICKKELIVINTIYLTIMQVNQNLRLLQKTDDLVNYYLTNGNDGWLNNTSVVSSPQQVKGRFISPLDDLSFDMYQVTVTEQHFCILTRQCLQRYDLRLGEAAISCSMLFQNSSTFALESLMKFKFLVKGWCYQISKVIVVYGSKYSRKDQVKFVEDSL